MNIDIIAKLEDYNQQMLGFSIACKSDSTQNELILPGLAVGNGIEVSELKVADPQGQPVQFRLDGSVLFIPAPCFDLSYRIRTVYTHCVGADLEVDFLYPFANSQELFFGSGCMAVPAGLRDRDEDIRASFRLSGVPQDWQVYSNLLSERISPAGLDNCFLYYAPASGLPQHTYSGTDGEVVFRLCVQHGKTIPIPASALWQYLDTCCAWMEANLGPLSHVQQVNILVLQAPADFAKIAGGRTFATGENMLNGIAVYAPDDPAYLERMFRHSSYEYFLQDGLAHELMHFYTTSAWQGKYKSMLYPAADCPPAHARLLGESLATYLHDAFVRRHFTGSDDAFIEHTLAHALQTQQQRGKPHPLVSLFVLDAWLGSHGSSLLSVSRRMIARQREQGEPYHSMDVLVRAIEEDIGLEPAPDLLDGLHGEGMVDPGAIASVLQQHGFSTTALEKLSKIAKEGNDD